VAAAAAAAAADGGWRTSPRVFGFTLALESVEKASAVVSHVDASWSRILKARLAALGGIGFSI
jgi:hypothetical protein